MRTVPVVVISALDEIDSVVRAIEMGAEDYLFKPFDPVLLRARIGALLERKRLVNELAVQAKLASLGALTAGIAHEIKNPLNFVMNFAQLAEESAREQLRKIDDAGTPSAELLGELRELAEDTVRRHREDSRARGARRRHHRLHAGPFARAARRAPPHRPERPRPRLRQPGVPRHEGAGQYVSGRPSRAITTRTSGWWM